jgi:class 3 adenylate cyclase
MRLFMPSLPTGTVTFLFTDIEGSTTLLQRLGDRRYAEVLAEHQRLLRDAFAQGNGQEVDTQGDAFLVAFPRARDAVATAVMAQRSLMKHGWPDGASLRVRMGLHTGEPVRETGGYVGLDVHRAARIGAAGHGCQILLSDVTHGLVARDLPDGVSLRATASRPPTWLGCVRSWPGPGWGSAKAGRRMSVSRNCAACTGRNPGGSKNPCYRKEVLVRNW